MYMGMRASHFSSPCLIVLNFSCVQAVRQAKLYLVYENDDACVSRFVLEDLYVLKALPWSEVSLPTPVCVYSDADLTLPFRKELLLVAIKVGIFFLLASYITISSFWDTLRMSVCVLSFSSIIILLSQLALKEQSKTAAYKKNVTKLCGSFSFLLSDN